MSRRRQYDISPLGCFGLMLLFAGCTSIMCPSRPQTTTPQTTTAPAPVQTYQRPPDPQRAAREMAAVEAEMKKVNAAPVEDTQRPDLESLRGMVNQADAYQRNPDMSRGATVAEPFAVQQPQEVPVRIHRVRTRRAPDSASYSVPVRSYTRKDGTHVPAHSRRRPRR